MSDYKFSGPVRSELARAVDRATLLLRDLAGHFGDLPYDRVKPVFDEIDAVRDKLKREAEAWAKDGTSVPYYNPDPAPVAGTETA